MSLFVVDASVGLKKWLIRELESPPNRYGSLRRQ
jgi:hypothetical protein